jgi:hypothetical protein
MAKYGQMSMTAPLSARLEGEDTFRQDGGELPPMMQPLDVVLPTFDEVHDLRVVTRELPEGKGKFEALHNCNLAKSLMTGAFESSYEAKGVTHVTKYEGTFLNDPHAEQPTPHGQGTRVNADQSTYQGQWKNGFPDGHGEWRAPPPGCESYLGDWKRGKKNGWGAQKFANGDLYEGDWADGKFQDRGKYTYANGDVFLGIFEQGVKKNGSFYFTDGRVSRRTWERGQLVSSQDFDSRRRTYQPTLTHAAVHAPERNYYGSTINSRGMMTSTGIRFP